jgi:glutathione S-transferase
MALSASGVPFESREVSLRNKPAEMLAASPKGTVPVLITLDGTVIDESYEIMKWALRHNDPQGWLPQNSAHWKAIDALVEENDTSFKKHLDAYKYSSRHPEVPVEELRQKAMPYIRRLDAAIALDGFLFERRCGIADVALFPFMRQYRNVDPEWFDSLQLDALNAWLNRFLEGDLFAQVMSPHE